MKTFFVTLLFSFIQHLSVILTFNFHYFANFKSRKISISWNINDLYWFDVHHLLSYVVFVSQCLFVSQVRNCHPIIRRITRNASNNTCSLFHANCHHGKSIYFLIDSQWSSYRKTKNFFSLKFANDFNFLVLFCQSLISHISCRFFCANKNLIVFHLDSCVLSSWQQIATCLPIHSFRS
jgi:hypothetical protein